MSNIGIIGAGSWGTSLAYTFKKKHQVSLWNHDSKLLDQIKKDGCNNKYLPGIKLNGIHLQKDIKLFCDANDFLILAVPTKHTHTIINIFKPFINKKHQLISASKGVEIKSFLINTEVIESILADKINSDHIFALSGPSHAEELAKKLPTTIVIGGKNSSKMKLIQEKLSCESLRVYGTSDIKGIQICGALKNVIAIASGIAFELNLGINAVSGLITRGLVELREVLKSMGGDNNTIYGLSGLGDMIATCISDFSRNKQCGHLLVQNLSIDEIKKRIGQTVEGINTAKALYDYGKIHDIKLPIVESVYQVIYSKKKPRDMVLKLMGRNLRYE